MTSGMRELLDTWEKDFIGFWHRDIYLLIAQVAFMKLAIGLIAILAALCIPPGAGENAAGDNAEYWSSLGDRQFLNGSIQEAAESYDEALRLDPANVYLWVNKGKALANMGRFQDAIACFDQASAINSSYVEPLFLKAVSYTHLDVYKRQPFLSTKTLSPRSISSSPESKPISQTITCYLKTLPLMDSR